MTGEGFTTGTQVDNVNVQRVAIAPSITWRPDNDTTFTVMASYQNDPKAGFYNFYPAVGTVLPSAIGTIPRNFDPGDPAFDSHSRTQASIGYKFEHKIDDTFTVRQNFRFLSVDDQFKNVFGFGVGADPSTLNRYSFINDEDLDYMTVDTQLQADVDTWMVHHTFLVGVDYTRTSGVNPMAWGLPQASTSLLRSTG